jgi:hypothetical protein
VKISIYSTSSERTKGLFRSTSQRQIYLAKQAFTSEVSCMFDPLPVGVSVRIFLSLATIVQVRLEKKCPP